ncbi:uncharacterized protein IUM83_04905 [Phytophthora cinnamomi]|uniref:uncharacterized protein n=1 Tax=Phytophthora cinnamomi TaxID=4785 RepID=UPI00355949E6|nr:hypothetical protein IUM83_04905 [Phytophthora cinnamomi]
MDFLDLVDEVRFLTSAEERAKNRVHVKRLYYRKLNVLDRLQHEVDTLEVQHKQLLAKHHQRDSCPTPQGATVSALKAYVELAQIQTALIKENAELTRVNATFLAAEKQLGQLVDAQNRGNVKIQQEQDLKRKNPVVSVVRLTLEFCIDIAKTAYGEFKAIRERLECSSGTRMFGWRDRHIFLPDQLMFSLEKVFPHLSMQKMVQGIWQVVSDPELIKIMSPRDASMHFHVMQRVNEDAVVFFHTLDREGSDERVQAFILSMRINLGAEGCLMIFRTLDPKTFLTLERSTPARRGRKKIEPQKEIIWMDMFLWSFCEYAGDRQEVCRYTYGGTTKDTKATSCGWCMKD